jgi:hypothetical protein
MAKEFKASIGATRPLRFRPAHLIILPYRLEFEMVSAQDSARLAQFADDVQVPGVSAPLRVETSAPTQKRLVSAPR